MQGPDAPTPTTPNRWRRRASRLWWWMLPGMIATIVTVIPCVAWARLGTKYSGTGKVPGGVLTGLGWSPAGPLNASEPPAVKIGVGYSSTTYYFSFQRPTPAWVSELGLPSLNPQLPACEQVRCTMQYGIPIPWLTRTGSMVGAGDDRTPGHDDAQHIFVTPLFFGPIEATRSNTDSFAFKYLTFIPDPLGFLLNTVIFSTLWMPITAWHRRRKTKHTNCTRCGYSREGLAPDTVCPECGQKPVH